MRETDLAWLAGIVDGEGCIAFHRRNDCGKHRHVVRCDVKIAMADKATILRVGALLAEIVGGDRVVVFEERRKVARARPLWRVEVNSKGASQALLKTVLPYLFTKKLEAELCLGYLERALTERKYRTDERDRRLAELATGLRHGSGEARVEAMAALGQVIPYQASDGPAQAGGSDEGLETRSSPPNGVTQECPAPTPNVRGTLDG